MLIKKTYAAGGRLVADILYIKIGQKIRVENQKVTIGELGDVWCTNSSVQARCRSLHYITMKEKRELGDILQVTQVIQKEYPQIQIENMGETDFILEYVTKKKKNMLWEWAKVIFVCLIIFFGSAFSIMTFNADVSVDQLFGNMHRLMTGTQRISFTWLEGGYSAGLFLGIIIFYNHFKVKSRIEDPTPLEVEMREYEKTVNQAIIDQNERIKAHKERKKKEVNVS